MPDPTVEALRKLLPPGTDAAHLLSVARDLAYRIRDVDPVDIHAELHDKSKAHLVRIIMTLISLVPVDATAADLLAWAGAITGGTDEESIRMRACYEIAYREATLDFRHARQKAEAAQ